MRPLTIFWQHDRSAAFQDEPEGRDHDAHHEHDGELDEALDDTFPASDPPSTTVPHRDDDDEDDDWDSDDDDDWDSDDEDDDEDEWGEESGWGEDDEDWDDEDDD